MEDLAICLHPATNSVNYNFNNNLNVFVGVEVKWCFITPNYPAPKKSRFFLFLMKTAAAWWDDLQTF